MKSVEHTLAFELQQPVSEVFPLFSPEGEKYWVPGWDYQNVMGTTELFEDYVFLTNSHDHGTTVAIWLVKRFDPETHTIEYYKVEPDDKIGLVRVCCVAQAAERTKVEVTYRYIALSKKAEDFISRFTAEAYKGFIGKWQILLSQYFASKS
jgi:hypothetical protein